MARKLKFSAKDELVSRYTPRKKNPTYAIVQRVDPYHLFAYFTYINDGTKKWWTAWELEKKYKKIGTYD